MMGDQSLAKLGKFFLLSGFSARYSESSALDLVTLPGCRLAVWPAIAQRGVANTREAYWRGTSGFVVVGAPLDCGGPTTQGIERTTGLLRDRGCAQDRSCARE